MNKWTVNEPEGLVEDGQDALPKIGRRVWIRGSLNFVGGFGVITRMVGDDTSVRMDSGYEVGLDAMYLKVVTA